MCNLFNLKGGILIRLPRCIEQCLRVNFVLIKKEHRELQSNGINEEKMRSTE